MKKPNLELRNPDELIPYKLNSKIHDTNQVKRIMKSIQDFGFDQPIVVDVDGVIIKGHGRRLAAIELGLKAVPVLIRDDLTPEQIRAARLADNRVAISGIDTDLLQEELASLDFDMTGIFDAKELEFMSADLAQVNDAGFVADLDEELVAQAEETTRTLDRVATQEVKLEKVLGFKSIKGKDEQVIAFFQAIIEDKTGLEGQEAFVAYAKQVVEAENGK